MTDTRTQFEAHFKLSSRQAKKDNSGEYIDEKVRDKWEGWQAAKAESAARISQLERTLISVGNGTIELERVLRQARRHIMDWWRPEGSLPPAKSPEIVAAIDTVLAKEVK